MKPWPCTMELCNTPVKRGLQLCSMAGRQAHNCKTKPNSPMERQIIMLQSFDLLKHYFSPKQRTTILLGVITHQAQSTELLPLVSYLWKTDSHSFWSIPNKKPHKNQKTRQFIPRPGLCSSWQRRTCRQLGAVGVLKKSECQKGPNCVATAPAESGCDPLPYIFLSASPGWHFFFFNLRPIGQVFIYLAHI